MLLEMHFGTWIHKLIQQGSMLVFCHIVVVPKDSKELKSAVKELSGKQQLLWLNIKMIKPSLEHEQVAQFVSAQTSVALCQYLHRAMHIQMCICAKSGSCGFTHMKIKIAALNNGREAEGEPCVNL